MVSAVQPAPVQPLSGIILSPSPDPDHMSTGSHRTQLGSVATFANDEEYHTIIEHLSVLYLSLWSCIRDSPSLVSLANTDQALDNRNVILAYNNIRSQYILSSGMGIMPVSFSAFFEFPGQSLPVEELLLKIDSYQNNFMSVFMLSMMFFWWLCLRHAFEILNYARPRILRSLNILLLSRCTLMRKLSCWFVSNHFLKAVQPVQKPP